LKSAFVSGAAGFVGSHLVDRLLEEGFAVIGVDNLLTGKVGNLDLAKANSNFKFIELDVVDEIPDLGTKFDFIFHAASPASPPKYFEHPIETMMVNSIGTKNLIDLSIKCGSRFIFFSTSEVYGDPLEHPQRESYWGNVNPIGPRSIYDEAKRFGEALVAQFVREKKVNAGIIRIFNTYGPRLDPHDGRVVSTFVRQAINGEALTINGDGNQTRSFCYISDLIDGIIKMAKSSEFGPINLGNPNEMTINELIQQISKMLSKDLETVNLPELKDDPVRRKPDISLAKEKLDWEPKVSLIQGLQLLISSQ
jgi:nucleoside-diphosphate-sugar epimerase